MTFVAYPSTPDFYKFLKDVRKNMVSRDDGDPLEGEDEDSERRKATFVGTVKLHGTNTSIRCLSVQGTRPTFQYQSRNRIITARDDNSGTVAFLSKVPMSTLIDEILRIRGVDTFEEIFIAGEWAGTGIQKGVAVASLERFFAIFNIQIDGHWVDIRDYKTVQLPEYRVYNIINFKTYEITMDLWDKADRARAYDLMKNYTQEVAANCPVGADLLQVKGAKVILKNNAPQVLGGEGIVWTLVSSWRKDTALLNFKTKGEQFFVVTQAPKPSLASGTNPDKVAAFVDYALGEGRLEQGIDYLQEMGKDSGDTKNLGEFIKWTIADVIKEEGWRLADKADGESSLLDQGVTEADVKMLVGSRARQWYRDRQSNNLSAE